MLTARIEKGKLIVEIELQEPTPSASGKTLVVASSRGNQKTEAMVNGKTVIIGLNAYIQKG
jgi:hypothetical protein